VTLTWTPVTDAESGIGEYLVYRDNLMIGQMLPTTAQFQDVGIAPSETFSYRLTAVNKAYLESPSCSSVTPLGIPTGLVAAASSGTQVQVTWSAVAGANHYVVERKSAGGEFTAVGNPAANAFTDTVSPASAFLYRVRAANGVTTSEPSAFDLATTIAFTDDPVTPGILVKAIHIAEVRQAAAAVRALAGLTAPSWTGSASLGTAILSVHITEARTHINDARTVLGVGAVTFTDSIGAGTPIKAVHMQELRNAVK
jgi:hypothetical protein